MNHPNFIRLIEQYYGRYEPVSRRVVIDHVVEIPEERLEEVFSELVKQISKRWGFVPDVAAIFDAWNGVKDRRIEAESEGRHRLAIETREEQQKEQQKEIDRLREERDAEAIQFDFEKLMRDIKRRAEVKVRRGQ